MKLEQELGYLGGMCSSSLMRRDLVLPAVTSEEMEEDMDILEEAAHMVQRTGFDSFHLVFLNRL